MTDYVSRWTIPSGETLTYMVRNPPDFERYRILQGPAGQGQNVRMEATLLFMEMISYQDAGNYTCEVRSSSPTQSPWFSASVELQLEGKHTCMNRQRTTCNSLKKIGLDVMHAYEWSRAMVTTSLSFAVNLQVNVSNVTAYNSDSSVELECEMTLYVRADEDLQWFRGSEMIASRNDRYTISYRNGLTGAAQNGGNVTVPGRVSVLTISNPQLSDSGTYTCRILGTEQSTDVQLNVEPGELFTLVV